MFFSLTFNNFSPVWSSFLPRTHFSKCHYCILFF